MQYPIDQNGDTHLRGHNGRPLSHAHSPPNTHTNGDPSPSSGSPHIVAQSPRPSPALSAVHSVASTPEPTFQPKARRRKNKRIVDLDDKDSIDDLRHEPRGVAKSHARHSSDVGVLRHDVHLYPSTLGYPSRNDLYTPAQDSDGHTSSAVETSSGAGDIISSLTVGALPPLAQSPTSESLTAVSRIRQSAGTSRTVSSAKSNKRRVRLSPSMYEPASASPGFPERRREGEEGSEGSTVYPAVSEAEKFRKRIEALRNEVGDSWLKVLSQTHLGSPDEGIARRS
jgi:hypothetical protein